MQRRKLLLGVGTAAGVAGAVGSGAFTSVSARRDVAVQVADDSDALLSLQPGTGPNAEAFTTVSDGLVGLDFSETDAGGSGLGTDSTYQFDGLLSVRNRGTQRVYVYVRVSGGVSNDELYFYPGSDTTVQLRDRANEVVELAPGESQTVGVFVDTSVLERDVTTEATFVATTERPDESFTVGETPSDAVLVSRQSDRGEFDQIQPAVDAIREGTVQASALQVDPGRYATDGPISVAGVPDLRVRGDGSGGDPESNTVLENQVTVSGADSVTLQDLRVTGVEDGDDTTGDGVVSFGTDDPVSNVVLENVAVVDNRQAGVALRSGGQLLVRNSVIDDNGGSGIDTGGVSGRIEFTRIRNNGGSGVEMDGLGSEAELELLDVVVENNERSGVDVFGDTVDAVTVAESVIDDNGGAGLAVGTAYDGGGLTTVAITDVSASDNGGSGVIVFGESASDLTVRNVRAVDNGANGVDLNGVSFATPTVERVTAAGNDGNGIVLGNLIAETTATGQLRRTLVKANGEGSDYSGVAVFDGVGNVGTNVAVGDSNVVDNAGVGVSTDDAADGVEVSLSNVFLDGNERGTSAGVGGTTAGSPVPGVGADGD